MPKINEVPELLNLSDDDWILGLDSETNITGKIKLSTLKDYIGVVSTPNYEYLPNPLLWLEGSLTDQSGNNRNASPVGTNSPTIVTGLDNKPALRWNGSGNQELQISPFLSGTSGVTLYCVFTISANTNYNLIRTANLDDYWRFSNDGAGYIGAFLADRRNGYPSSMPSSGSHLVSIHATGSNYEVLVDNQSKGLVTANYTPGDRFRIVTNDKPFNGDVSLLMVYPYFSPTSTEHRNHVLAVKQNYPSLSLFL
jgi:hypothetical protein